MSERDVALFGTFTFIQHSNNECVCTKNSIDFRIMICRKLQCWFRVHRIVTFVNWHVKINNNLAIAVHEKKTESDLMKFSQIFLLLNERYEKS